MIGFIVGITLLSTVSTLKSGRYDLLFETSDDYWSGTDANVYVELFGKKSSTLSKVWLNAKPESFNLGSIDRFIIDIGSDLGALEKILIGQDNSGSHAGWKLKRLTVRSNDGRVYQSVINQWIGGSYPAEITIDLKSNCGLKQTGRIVSGVDSLPHAWPWYAQLKLEKGRPNHCGGTLIHPLYIVTAAHCVDNVFIPRKSYRVTLGEHDLNKNENTEFITEFDQVYIHPSWSRIHKSNDIAVIKLKQPATLNNHINTICLPKQDHFTPKGKNCMVIGFGRGKGNSQPTILQQTGITITSNSECAKAHSLITKNQVCGRTPTSTACKGDSGGPLNCLNDEGRYDIQGVVSRGTPSCPIDGINVFTRIANYIDWVNEKLEQDL